MRLVKFTKYSYKTAGEIIYINADIVTRVYAGTRIGESFTYIEQLDRKFNEVAEQVEEVAKRLGYGAPHSNLSTAPLIDPFFDENRQS